MSTLNFAELAWGPGFVGLVISNGLFGTVIAQTILYFRTFPEDRRSLKSLVLVLCFLDILHTVFLSKLYWTVLITARVNPMLLYLPWEISVASILTYLVTFIVQCFYDYRVWRISGKNRLLTGTIALLALTQVVSGTFFGTRQLISATQGVIGESANVATGSIELSTAVAGDLLITGSLVYYLQSKRTGVRRSENVLQKLIIYTINMGLLPTIVATIALGIFLSPNGIFSSAAPHFIVAKCYTNSLIATLNARVRFRKMFHDRLHGTNAMPVLTPNDNVHLEELSNSGGSESQGTQP